jgi:single-strand DNA-binding protein
MAGSVNKVIILGNVGRDPEIRSMQSGSRVCNLSVATSESWKDRNSGERKEKTEWHRVTIWPDTLVDIIEKYVRKGDKIYVEGQLETRKWTDQQGAERFSTEIVVKGFSGSVTLLGDRRGDGGGTRQSGRLAEREPGDDERAPQRSGGGRNELDDEIPF